MPKSKSSLTNVFELFSPQIDDPKQFINKNSELIVRGDEDTIKVSLPEGTINDFVDPTTIFSMAASNISFPGTIDGAGENPLPDLTKVINVAGNPRISKYLASRRGTFALAPFGLVFSAVGDNYADAQFTGTISDAYSTLSGDPVKAASFAAYEARLTRAVANALNRELEYSDGNAQSIRLAQLFCYERDLLWLQEVVNGVARFLGWYEFANKSAILNPALAASGTLQEPEFYTRVNTLARIVAQFRTIDPDTHVTLQFLNDFHLIEKDGIRTITIDKTDVAIHVPFSTNGAAVENITNAAPIPYRITTTELNLVKSDGGNILHYHDLPTNDWVECLIYGVTTAKALAALDEVILLAHGMIENYRHVLKYLNTIEGKKIATLNSMADYLYFDGKSITPIQPYYSYEERALKNGVPMITNDESEIPNIYAKCLLDFNTGGTYTTQARLQETYNSNFAEFGIDLNEKTDNLQEYFWQIWVPYSAAVEVVVDISGVYRFVNPFNGLIYTPQTAFPYITAATSISRGHFGMSMDGIVAVGMAVAYVAATKNFPMTYVRSDTGSVAGLIAFNLNGAFFGSPTVSFEFERHDMFRAQEYAQFNAFGLRNYYISAKNVALKEGYFGVKPHTVRSDNFLLPIDNQYFTKHASAFYADMYPAINFAKSVQAASK